MQRNLQGLGLKLAISLALSLVLICAIVCVFTAFGGARLVDDWMQRAYQPVAVHLGNEVQLLFADRARDDAITAQLVEAERWNSGLRAYVLDESGRILHSASDPGSLPLRDVSVGPIRELLDERHPSFPVWGDDPEDAGAKRVFGAYPLILRHGPGFLYVTFRHPLSERLRSWPGIGDVTLRMFPQLGITIVLMSVGFATLLLYLSAQLRRLSEASERLERGDYETVVPVVSDDTLGDLAARFNRMRASILQQDRELADRETRRRLLLANVAHDLRAPLSVIRGYLDVLERRRGSLKEESRALSAISRNVQRQRGLLNDLEALSRMEPDSVPPSTGPVNLHDVVTDLLESAAVSAAERNVTLSSEVSGDVRVEGNRAWLERMISNLLSNAIRYTPPGGTVRISLTGGAAAVIRIEDTGLGIPAAAVPRIFDEFFRVPRDPESDPGGTGLGLSIVRRIAEHHGGHVEVQSREGEGSAFTVTLPFSPGRRSTSPRADDSALADEVSEPSPDWALVRFLLACAVAAGACVSATSSAVGGGSWAAVMAMAVLVIEHTRVPSAAAAAVCVVWLALFKTPVLPLAAATLYLAAVTLVWRRTNRRIVMLAVVGVLIGGLTRTLPTIPDVISVSAIGLALLAGLGSFTFLKGHRREWLALALPATAVWLPYGLTAPKDTVNIGALSALLLSLVLFTRFGPWARRIEYRIANLFLVILLGTVFVQGWRMTRVWGAVASDAMLPDMERIGRMAVPVLERAIRTGEASEREELFETFARYFSGLSIFRVRNGEIVEVAGRGLCWSSSCQWRTIDVWSKDDDPEPPFEPSVLHGRRSAVHGMVFPVLPGSPPKEHLVVSEWLMDVAARELVNIYAVYGVISGSLIAIFISIGTRVVLWYTVATRIKALDENMERIERGGEESRPTIGPPDAIGRLERALDAMLTARSDRRAALDLADRRRRELIEAILAAFAGPHVELEETEHRLADAVRVGDQTAADECLRHLARIVAQQAEIVDELLTLSKLENMGELARHDRVRIEEVLEEVTQRFPGDVAFDAEESLPLIHVDLERFGKALAFTLDDVAREGRSLRICVSRQEGLVQIDLATQHSGDISSGHLPAGSSSGSELLRRAISDRIVRLHGGAIGRGPGRVSLRIPESP